jgi:hypothetical protein
MTSGSHTAAGAIRHAVLLLPRLDTEGSNGVQRSGMIFGTGGAA